MHPKFEQLISPFFFAFILTTVSFVTGVVFSSSDGKDVPQAFMLKSIQQGTEASVNGTPISSKRQMVFVEGDEVTVSTGSITIVRPNEAQIALFSNGKALMQGGKWQIESGQVIASAAEKGSVLAGPLEISLNNGQVLVNRGAEVSSISSLGGEVFVTFSLDGKVIKKILLPQERTMIVADVQISPLYADLRFSKLVKELKIHPSEKNLPAGEAYAVSADVMPFSSWWKARLSMIDTLSFFTFTPHRSEALASDQHQMELDGIADSLQKGDIEGAQALLANVPDDLLSKISFSGVDTAVRFPVEQEIWKRQHEDVSLHLVSSLARALFLSDSKAVTALQKLLSAEISQKRFSDEAFYSLFAALSQYADRVDDPMIALAQSADDLYIAQAKEWQDDAYTEVVREGIGLISKLIDKEQYSVAEKMLSYLSTQSLADVSGYSEVLDEQKSQLSAMVAYAKDRLHASAPIDPSDYSAYQEEQQKIETLLGEQSPKRVARPTTAPVTPASIALLFVQSGFIVTASQVQVDQYKNTIFDLSSVSAPNGVLFDATYDSDRQMVIRIYLTEKEQELLFGVKLSELAQTIAGNPPMKSAFVAVSSSVSSSVSPVNGSGNSFEAMIVKKLIKSTFAENGLSVSIQDITIVDSHTAFVKKALFPLSTAINGRNEVEIGVTVDYKTWSIQNPMLTNGNVSIVASSLAEISAAAEKQVLLEEGKKKSRTAASQILSAIGIQGITELDLLFPLEKEGNVAMVGFSNLPFKDESMIASGRIDTEKNVFFTISFTGGSTFQNLTSVEVLAKIAAMEQKKAKMPAAGGSEAPIPFGKIQRKPALHEVK